MSKKIVVLGASLGGLVAASKLTDLGYEVTVVERGATVGGLYNKVPTPFGIQELGMHVVYANREHLAILNGIFGEDAFNVLCGHMTDIGASANFGSVYFDSHYPCLLGHPLRETVLHEIMTRFPCSIQPSNAFEEAVRRFGESAAREIISPILKKLWFQPITRLTPDALHCFFDLRRLVVTDKKSADFLKDHAALDEVIANPIQSQPKGEVFGGRMGLTFNSSREELVSRVGSWAESAGVSLWFNAEVECKGGDVRVNGELVRDCFDACIFAIPVHSFATESSSFVDQVQLSIHYFKMKEELRNSFPAYYVLLHDERFKASRVVNYSAYGHDNLKDCSTIIAVESIHEFGTPPSEDELLDELTCIFPGIKVDQVYSYPKSVSVLSPTVRNAEVLDSFQEGIVKKFQGKPIFFTGMRTDTGVFFSHHTIGLAYASALECHRELSRN